MSRSRSTAIRVALAWTIAMLLVAAVLGSQAMVSLYDGQQACFFGYPAVPCPAADDPAVARLTFAFFGVPAAWLAGLVVVGLAWAWRRRRREGSTGR